MLDEALSTTCKPSTTNKSLAILSCAHQNVTREEGSTFCKDCGVELPDCFQKDDMGRKRLEPTRCQVRKQDEKGIYKDVERMGFSEIIVSKANSIFADTTQGQIYRGNSRKAIIFACIFHAFKIAGKPQSCDSLIEIFKLERKVGLRGLKIVGLQAPKNSLIRNSHITPCDLIREIMKKFEASPEQVAQVEELYKRTENRSSILNRCRPQSVAAGLTYYYIRREQKEIPIKDFVSRVKLSELTVQKIAKEIAHVLGTPEIMV